jgi:phosphatidylserine/phosphatidylglycerophosphate/cardiolipin synthase-like enzyme
LLDRILGIIDAAADDRWALDMAIYEYELPAIAEAVERAVARGAQVRVLYHSRKNDPQTAENEHTLASLPDTMKKARLTSSIFHDKFIVLSKIGSSGNRLPQAVLCGSTNFTHNGVYRQANVVHVVRRRDVSLQYLELFEVLYEGPGPTDTRRWIDANNALDEEAELFVGFSPRNGGTDLAAFRALVEGAGKDVLFCTAFDLHDSIEEALLGAENDDILRFGVENGRSNITGFHRDRTAAFATAAFLTKGLEGFLKESTAGQRGNILIHTKLIVVDFTSDSPTVISGSHNLSGAASGKNDENYLIVKGNIDVADCYGVELMRIYDHYRFRWVAKQFPDPPKLTLTDEWTDRYFEPGLYMSDRLRFAGTE